MPKSAVEHINVEDVINRLPFESRERWQTYFDEEPELVIDSTEGWVLGLSTDQLLCRGYGHMWDVGGSTCAQLPRDMLGHALTCLRCASEKWEIYSQHTGYLIVRQYVSSKGYEKPPGALPVPRSVFRSAAQKRIKLVRNMKVGDVRDEFQNLLTRFLEEHELTPVQQHLCDPNTIL